MAFDAEHTGPDPIDVHVGKRLRQRRVALGISQTALADHLGITFQQIQKYETGANRISASRLFRAAQLLQTHPGFIYEGLPDLPGLSEETPQDRDARLFVATPEGAALLRRACRLTPRNLAVVDDVMVQMIGAPAHG